MRRLFWLLILVAPCSAHAVNCSLTSGASQATVQAAIAGVGSNSCTGTANGTTVLFNAGNYTINYNTTVPCGATITGPVVPFTNPSSVTAHVSGLVNGGWLFSLGCNSSSPTTTFQYLEYDAGRPGTRNPPVNVGSQSSGNLGGPCPGGPTDGGGFADLNAGTSNVTFQYNYIHGNQADFCSGPGGVYPDCGSGNGTCWGNDNDNDTFVWMEGDAGSQGGGDPGDYNRGIHDVNIFFYWNIFGASSDGTIANGDCSNIMQTPFYHGDRYDAIGGFCAAIGIHENTNNLQIANNVFQFQEQPVKIFEGCQQNYPQQTNCLADGSQFSPQINAIFNNNFVQYWHRIALENQGGPTPMDYISNVVILPQTAGGWGTWGFSTPSGPTNNDNNNYSWWQSGTVGPGMYEWWGNNGTLNNNFGQVEGAANNALFGFAGPPAFIQFDNWQNVNGTCAPPSYPNCQGGGWVGSEEGITQFPDFTGSTYTTNISSVQSAAPTISPTPTGTYSGTVSVTLSDAGAMNGGVGPQGHTTIYYTTNGSQPSASQATNFCNANTTGTTSCTISVAAGSTVNALGMWGSINQPRSYPTNHGFTPSGVVSAHYISSGGGTPTVNGIALGPSGSTITVGNSLQIVATCSYSDGSHTNCTTTDAFGNTASGWVSSNATVATITSAGVLTARAAGSTNVTAAVGAFSSSPLAVTVNAAAPTLTGVAIADGGVGTISMGQTVQATATAQYNGGAITTNCSAAPDAQGTVCNAWTSNTPAIASISSSGLITGVTQGTASMTVKATNGTTVFTSNPALSITVTSNTPPPATLTGVTVSFSGQTSVQAGNTISAAANCAYSDGTTTNCTTTDAHGTLAGSWSSSSTGVATINSSTGVAMGVAAGFTNISVHAGTFMAPNFQLQVTPATAGNILGSNQFDFSGQNFPNNFVATYACAPSNPSIVSSMNLYLPAGSYPPSTPYDVIIVPALSSTTMASSAICSGGYTTTGTSTDVGWHAISPRGAGCGIIAANSCYWVGDVTTGSGVGQGYSDCDNGTASCNGAPPANGNGTYHFGFNSVTFGTYTNMPAALTFSGAYQASVYAALSTPNPTLTGGFLANQGTVNSLLIGQTAQFTASCSYSDGTSIQCFPTPDKYGNTATGFTSSNSSVIVVTNGGLATAVGTGAANVTATLTSSATSPWTITVSTPPNQAPPASGGHKRPKR